MAVSDSSGSDDSHTGGAGVLPADEATSGKLGSTGDLEDLLKLAEHLQGICDHTSTRISLTRAVEMVGLTITIGGLWIWRMARMSNESVVPTEYLVVASSCLALLVIYLELGPVRRLMRRLGRDRRALRTVVDLMLATENFVANKDYWTALQKGTFQIRRARIDGEVNRRRIKSGNRNIDSILIAIQKLLNP